MTITTIIPAPSFRPAPPQVMLPPGARGTISYIAPAGEYTVNDEVIEIEFQVRHTQRGGRSSRASRDYACVFWGGGGGAVASAGRCVSVCSYVRGRSAYTPAPAQTTLHFAANPRLQSNRCCSPRSASAICLRQLRHVCMHHIIDLYAALAHTHMCCTHRARSASTA